MKKYIIGFILFSLFGISSCAKRDGDYLPLEGTTIIKLKISNIDSIVSKGSNIQLSIQRPDSFVTTKGEIIRNIDYVIFDCSPVVMKVNPNITGFQEFSPNFVKGNVENNHSRTTLSIKKGKNYSSDTYVCKDTGIFWFHFVAQSIDYKIVTTDGKKYKAMVTLDFDVPDRHTQMLLNYCPQLTEGVNYMSSEGFGHYVFRVVP